MGDEEGLEQTGGESKEGRWLLLPFPSLPFPSLPFPSLPLSFLPLSWI